MADAKVSSLSELSVPDFNDDVYVVDDTGPTSYKCGTDRLFGLGGFTPGGRLTLTSGTPVTTSDVTGAGTLYYAPYQHNRIRIYDGTRWKYYVFTERSLSLTLTSGKNYDVFIYDNSGTLTLELSAAWTDDTTRADALTTQDGVTVKSGATTRLWLGTIRASGTNTTEDSLTKRFNYNAYNRVLRAAFKLDTTSHTYNSATARSWNNDAANQIEFVFGNAQDGVLWAIQGDIQPPTAVTGFPAIWGSLDWTSGSPSSDPALVISPSVLRFIDGTSMVKRIGLGYHYIRMVEADFATGVSTFASYVLSANLLI